jgi:hypothetical protein
LQWQQGYLKTERIFQISLFLFPFATRNLSSEHRSAKREEGFVKGESKGEPPPRFGYFSARESNARPGEGQTKAFAKSKRRTCKAKGVMNNE